jgi:hypothetical protein
LPEAFSSQAETLGDSENASKHLSCFQAKRKRLATRKMLPNTQAVFKPSGNAWRLGKCFQTPELFSSQAETLGDSENVVQDQSHFQLISPSH